jgi:hypothetical protein
VTGDCPLQACGRQLERPIAMGNEILTITENDSLSMRCLHLRGEVDSAVAACSFRGLIERSLERVGFHAVFSMCSHDEELSEIVIL